jgi:DDE domain
VLQDSTGATIDFLLSAKRDTVAAKRVLAKALGGANHPHPRVINTDKDAAYPPGRFWGAWRTIAGYEVIHDDPQRPSVLERGRCEARSAPSLYCLCLELKPNSKWHVDVQYSQGRNVSQEERVRRRLILAGNCQS